MLQWSEPNVPRRRKKRRCATRLWVGINAHGMWESAWLFHMQVAGPESSNARMKLALTASSSVKGPGGVFACQCLGQLEQVERWKGGTVQTRGM